MTSTPRSAALLLASLALLTPKAVAESTPATETSAAATQDGKPAAQTPRKRAVPATRRGTSGDTAKDTGSIRRAPAAKTSSDDSPARRRGRGHDARPAADGRAPARPKPSPGRPATEGEHEERQGTGDDVDKLFDFEELQKRRGDVVLGTPKVKRPAKGQPVRVRRAEVRPAAGDTSDAEAKAEARADARAEATPGRGEDHRGGARRASDSARDSSRVIRRVVVVNGRKIVDEEIRDGGSMNPDDLLEGLDLDELLKDIEKDLPAEVRRLREQAKRGGKGQRAQDSSSSSSSSSRRVVVVNGETVVDEASKDGKDVDPDELLDGLDLKELLGADDWKRLRESGLSEEAQRDWEKARRSMEDLVRDLEKKAGGESGRKPATAPKKKDASRPKGLDGEDGPPKDGFRRRPRKGKGA